MAIACSGAPEIREIRPECDPAERPVVDLDRRDVWDAMGAEADADGKCLNDGCRTYRRVEDTIDDLITWGKANEAVAREACA